LLSKTNQVLFATKTYLGYKSLFPFEYTLNRRYYPKMMAYLILIHPMLLVLFELLPESSN